MTTAPTQAVTITLPGPPVAYAVEPARLVAWLVGRGWALDPAFRDEDGVYYTRGVNTVWLPDVSADADYPRVLARAIQTFANLDAIEPAAIAALLAAPPEGPALQWAHASADTRAPVLALLDSEAADSRHNAAVARAEGKTAEALAEEGRAMAHEAAAAVLRASR